MLHNSWISSGVKVDCRAPMIDHVVETINVRSLTMSQMQLVTLGAIVAIGFAFSIWTEPILVLGAVLGAALVFLKPLPQNQAYHNFADKRRLMCCTNSFDVLSNIPFMIIGVYGFA